MGKPKSTTTQLRLSIGALEITGEYTGCEAGVDVAQDPDAVSPTLVSIFQVTVTDGADEVTDEFRYYLQGKKNKTRLSVRDLGSAFVWILTRAERGLMTFPEFRDKFCKDVLESVARERHDHCTELLRSLSYMDISPDMFPDLLKEVKEKYDLKGR